MKRILLIMFIGILLIGVASAAVWTQSLSSDLVSYYPLNESSGIGVDWVNWNNITHNFVNYTTNGILGNATFYNGSIGVNSTMPNSSIYAGTSFSISVWLYSQNNGTVSEFIITSDGGADNFIQIQKQYADHRVAINLKVNGTNCGNLDTTGNLTVGGWDNVVGVWNGTDSLIYRNGVLNNTKACAGERTEFNGTWLFGAKEDFSQNFGGYMDEIGIWNRTLGAAEVADLWNSGAGLEFGGDVSYAVISNTYNATTYEGLNESYTVNVTTNGSTPTTFLWYNGTRYTTTQSGTQPNMEFYANIVNELNVPYKSLTKDYLWEFEGLGNSTSYSQTVDIMNLTLCMGGNIYPFLNLTFKDEDTDANIEGKINSMTWYYWLTNANLNRTLSYTTSTPSDSFGFCFVPPDKTLHSDLTMTYANTSYPQRTFNFNTDTTNVTTNQTLYLLASADGIYVTFQVINTAEQPLEDIYVNATTAASGVVGSGYTDAAGSITFWLNPNVAHDFAFDGEGYDIFTTSITPTQTSYTVTLGGGTTSSTNINLQGGISYTINPVGSIYNQTTYIFNFTISSDYWNIDEFGFMMTNQTDKITIVSSVANGGTVSSTLNTGLNNTFVMEYWYLVNGTNNNGTVSWRIFDSSGTDWSIAYFFTDLKTYITGGIFGLDNFGFNIILFILIFVVTGVMSYKYGLTSPAAISALIFTLVLFLDVGVGIIPNPQIVGATAIPHFLTFITGIIMVGFIIREGIR